MVAESQVPQRVRSTHLSTLVIGFGIEETLIDRAAREYGGPVDRLYLRDRIGDGYYGGAEGYGESIETTVAALDRRIDELSYDRIVTVGRGIGGHAALLYGCLLGVSRIVSIEPYAHLIEAILEKYCDRRWRRELSRLPDPSLARRFEIPRLFEREQYQGEAHILLGTRPLHERGDAVSLNAIHAHWLGRSPQVVLHPFVEYPPSVLPDLDGGDRAIGLLSQFLFDDIPAISPESAPEIRISPRPRLQHPIHYNAKLTICRIDEHEPTNTFGADLSYAAAGDIDITMTRKMDDGLRRWIAENLLLDASPDDLARTLEVRGISRKETLQEVELARYHPYFFASKRLFNRISKRDWLVATYRKLNRLKRKTTKIERREKPTVPEFLKDYYSTGRPLILTGMMNLAESSRPDGLAEIARRPVDLRGVDEGKACDPWKARDLVDIWPASSEIFDHEHQMVERKGAFLWEAAAALMAPDGDERSNRLIAQLEGKSRVRLIAWWDVLLLEEAERSPRQLEDFLIPASHLTPIDRAESLEFVLNRGELLFVPAGCRVRLECLEAATMINFEHFVFDAMTRPS